MHDSRPRQHEEGLTLIEVLVALALFFIITVSVLQLYAASVAINLGSYARTDLIYKCERVVETIRMIQALTHQSSPPDVSGYGITLSAGASGTLPTDPTDTYWGQPGANVIDPNERYTLSWSVQDNTDFWAVTVEAKPRLTGASRYIGSAIGTKAVRYVAQIPKA
jgi:hypothetical protein